MLFFYPVAPIMEESEAVHGDSSSLRHSSAEINPSCTPMSLANVWVENWEWTLEGNCLLSNGLSLHFCTVFAQQGGI